MYVIVNEFYLFLMIKLKFADYFYFTVTSFNHLVSLMIVKARKRLLKDSKKNNILQKYGKLVLKVINHC